MNELKPCPFCGNTGCNISARNEVSISETEKTHVYEIWCPNCCVMVSFWDGDLKELNKTSVIELFNRRGAK